MQLVTTVTQRESHYTVAQLETKFKILPVFELDFSFIFRVNLSLQ